MRKLLKFLFILFLGVISCACVNMLAVHELNQKASDMLEEGDIKGALSRLEASVDLDGNIYESRYNLATVYLGMDEFEKAYENIKRASEINPKEPIVNYTYGVAAVKLAESLYEHKDEQGNMVKVEFRNSEDEKEAAQRYVNLLTEANLAFTKYTDLAPNAEDTQHVYSLIKDNEHKITQMATNYGIETGK